jgi:hypothetical protein
MPSRQGKEALFDLVSYSRRGPGRRDHLSLAEIAQISRTAHRAPEVMVKVLGRGGQDLKAVRRHLDYLRLRKDGELQIETDDGELLDGPGVSKELLEDWDLNLDELRPRSDLDTHGGASKKLVHKLMFSMPAGTPPDRVLAAVKNFAREEFALKHRYALALHTDEPHPHVHMVVKAVTERGERLHIRKATLREWRRAFAGHLRALGVEANATERAVRGATEPRKLDGIYRPMRDEKRYSTHMRVRVESVAAELFAGDIKIEPGKARLVATRKEVERGWGAVGEILLNQGQPELAAQVRRFADQMPPPRTDKETIAQELAQHASEMRARHSPPLVR